MWQGENQIKEYFGLRGFKCLCQMMMDEINELRQQHGLPSRTWPQVLAKMDTLMTNNKTDDEGAEIT